MNLLLHLCVKGAVSFSKASFGKISECFISSVRALKKNLGFRLSSVNWKQRNGLIPPRNIACAICINIPRQHVRRPARAALHWICESVSHIQGPGLLSEQ